MTDSVTYALVDSEGNAILDSEGNWRSMIVYATYKYLEGEVLLRPSVSGNIAIVLPIRGGRVSLEPLR